MTVSSTTREPGPFNGNDVTTAFPFTFKVFSEEDVELTHEDADGVQTVLVLDSDYSVSLNADQDNNPGGTITYPVSGSPLPTGEKLRAAGATAYSQAAAITNLGSFQPRVHENALDRAVVLIQQVLAKINRAIKFPLGDTASSTLPTAANRAGGAIVFDNNGNVDVSLDIGANLAAIQSNADAAAASEVNAATSEANAAESEAAAALSEAQAAAIVLGNFLQSGTGATSRTYSAKVREVQFSVKDFGAVGDGVADDTAAIQAAITAAPAGSVVFFPPGFYKVTSTITTGNKTLILQGSGFKSSIGAAFGNANYLLTGFYSGSVIFSTVTSGVALDLNPTSSWGMHVRDLAIVGPGSGTSIGIRVRSAGTNSIVKCHWWNVAVFNFYQGVQFAAVLNSLFAMLRLVGCTIGGTNEAYSSIGSNNNTFIALETYFTGTYGFQAYDSAGCRFIGPLIQNMDVAGKGLAFEESSANNVNDHLVLSPWLEHGGSTLMDSIYIGGGRNIRISDAHAAASGKINIAGGTRHQVLSGRFTGTGNVIVVGASASDCLIGHDAKDLDFDGNGTVSNSGTGTVLFGQGVVDCTAAALALTSQLHGGRTVTLNRAAGSLFTLPAATGSGMRTRIVISTALTSGAFVLKVANSSDVMQGFLLTMSDDPATVKAFQAQATSDTITLNRSTTGVASKGEWIEVVDAAANVWQVHGMTSSTGAEATPFSATV